MGRDLKFTKEILVSLLTLMQVRLPLQKGFYSIQGKPQNWRFTMVLLQWTGWSRKQKEVLLLLLQLPLVLGTFQQIKEKLYQKLNLTTSTSLIHGTLTSTVEGKQIFKSIGWIGILILCSRWSRASV